MKIGWIGAGIMGLPMTMHLMEHGHEVHICARRPEKVMEAFEKGAIQEGSIASLVDHCDVICTMVGFPSDVKEVYTEIFEHIQKGKTCIDFTTSSPELAKELYNMGYHAGAFVLDAPVTGGDVGARQGTLTILVGGDLPVYQAMQPVFETFGKDIYYCGSCGSGQSTKIANQIMIANTLQGICEAMSYLKTSHLEESMILSFLKNGAAGSKQLELNGQKMLEQDYAPGFYVKHFVKDLRIALENTKVDLKGVQLVLNEYLNLVDHGYSEQGTQCLIEYFKERL